MCCSSSSHSPHNCIGELLPVYAKNVESLTNAYVSLFSASLSDNGSYVSLFLSMWESIKKWSKTFIVSPTRARQYQPGLKTCNQLVRSWTKIVVLDLTVPASDFQLVSGEDQKVRSSRLPDETTFTVGRNCTVTRFFLPQDSSRLQHELKTREVKSVTMLPLSFIPLSELHVKVSMHVVPVLTKEPHEKSLSSALSNFTSRQSACRRFFLPKPKEKTCRVPSQAYVRRVKVVSVSVFTT